jgi:hypothetical protein
MSAKFFARPVSIFSEVGIPLQIESADEAYVTLMEWTRARGPAHEAALNASRAAMLGDVDTEVARGIFEGFARMRGVLVPDAVGAAAIAAAISATR